MSRYWVVAGLFVLSLITYIDRAAISSAKDGIAADLQLDDTAMGAVFSAFALGYAIAQVPSGWLADCFGPRSLLAGVVVLWSVLTALTGAAHRYGPLLGIRFLFGAAEAGAFPGSARAIYNWLPGRERGRANGVLFSGSRIGAALAFPLMAYLLESVGWRQAFFWLALPGLIWGVAWFALFRDQPQTVMVQEVPAGERRPVGRTTMILLMAQYCATNFTTFLCLSWMLPYLRARYRLAPAEGAFYAMLPLLFGACSQWITGWVVDRLYNSRHRAWSRRGPALAGFLLSAAAMAVTPLADTVGYAAILLTIAAFGAEMTITPSWAFCLDVGGEKSGTVSGAMNMAGNFGSFISSNAFPWIVRWSGSAAGYFWMVAVLNLAAGACWLRLAHRPQSSTQRG